MSDAGYIEFDDTFLEFEAVLNEQAEHSATVSEYVVEQGANAADHMRVDNKRVSLQAFVSNAPIRVGGFADMQTSFVELDVPKAEKGLAPTPGALLSAGASALASLLNGKPLYKAAVLKAASTTNIPKEVMNLLEDWQERSVLGKVYLPWRTYESMVITKITPTRTPTTGDAAEFSIEFQEIRLVESKLVTAPIPTEVRGKVMKAKGKQPTSPVRDPGPKQSILRSLLGNITE